MGGFAVRELPIQVATVIGDDELEAVGEPVEGLRATDQGVQDEIWWCS